MSLIEVLMGMGLLGLLSLFFAQLNTSAIRDQYRIKHAAELQDFVNTLKLALENPAVCSQNLATPGNFSKLTFDTQQPLPIEVHQLNLPSSGKILAKKGEPPLPGLKLQTLEFRQFQALTPGSDYLSMLHLELTEQGTNPGSPSPVVFQTDIPLDLKTQSSGTTATIVACGASASTDTDDQAVIVPLVCRSMGGQWDGKNCSLEQTSCASVGGHRDPTTGKCQLNPGTPTKKILPIRGGTCPTGKILVGLTEQGEPICEPGPQTATACGPDNHGVTFYQGSTRVCCYVKVDGQVSIFAFFYFDCEPY
jgi:hypothetical protein